MTITLYQSVISCTFVGLHLSWRLLCVGLIRGRLQPDFDVMICPCPFVAVQIVHVRMTPARAAMILDYLLAREPGRRFNVKWFDERKRHDDTITPIDRATSIRVPSSERRAGPA